MNLTLTHTITTRVIQSEYFESVLPRTERALKKSKTACKRLWPWADDYRSLMDCLLGVCSGDWDREIAAYYDDRSGQMRECYTTESIAAIDNALEKAVQELASLRSWPDDDWHHNLLREALRTFIVLPSTAHDFAAESAA
jgi:hypothetical protein